MAADVRWLGHSAFHLSGGGADVLIDPFLTGNPKAAATADELPADVIAAHARPRRPPRRHGRHRQAHGREGAGDRRAGGRDRGRRRRGRRRPQLRRHRHVRLGLGQDGPGLAHRGLAQGHRAHARRPADPLRRPPDLPPRRHRAVRRPEADRRPRRPRRARARADRRPLHDGPLRRRHRRRVHQPVPDDPDPLRHVPADRDRRAGLQVRRPERGLQRKCSCSTPATPTRCDDPRRRPDRGRAPLDPRRSAASSPTSKASPRPTASPASGTSSRSCACATRRRSRRSSRTASPTSKASSARTRWSRSRSSPSTTSRRSSASATECRSSPPNTARRCARSSRRCPRARAGRCSPCSACCCARAAGRARRAGRARTARVIVVNAAGLRLQPALPGPVRARSTRRAGELVHLERPDLDSFVVEPLRAARPTRATSAASCRSSPRASWTRSSSASPQLEPVEEGKARINQAAGYTLAFRVSRSPRSYGRLTLQRILNDLVRYAKMAKKTGKTLAEDALIRQRLAQLAIEVDVARCLSYRVATTQSRNDIPGPEAPANKVFTSEMMQRLAQVGMQMMGLYSQLEFHDQMGSPQRQNRTAVLNLWCLAPLPGAPQKFSADRQVLVAPRQSGEGHGMHRRPAVRPRRVAVEISLDVRALNEVDGYRREGRPAKLGRTVGLPELPEE